MRISISAPLAFVLMLLLISRYRVRGGAEGDGPKHGHRAVQLFVQWERGPVRRRRHKSGGVFFAASIHSSPKGTLLLPGLPSTILADGVWTAEEGKGEKEEGLSKLAAFSLGATERQTGWPADWLSMASPA